MTEDEMQMFLKHNAEEIKKAVKDKIISSLVTEYRWSFSEQIAKVVNDFVATEIVPDLKAHLQSEKGPIFTAAVEGARQIGNELTKAMVKKAATNMEGYRFGEMMKGIFQ